MHSSGMHVIVTIQLGGLILFSVVRVKYFSFCPTSHVLPFVWSCLSQEELPKVVICLSLSPWPWQCWNRYIFGLGEFWLQSCALLVWLCKQTVWNAVRRVLNHLNVGLTICDGLLVTWTLEEKDRFIEKQQQHSDCILRKVHAHTLTEVIATSGRHGQSACPYPIVAAKNAPHHLSIQATACYHESFVIGWVCLSSNLFLYSDYHS